MNPEINRDTYKWMESQTYPDVWEKFAKINYPIAYAEYHKDRRLSRALDIFGMIGAICFRWPVTDKTERITIVTKDRYIVMPKLIKTDELRFMNEDEIPIEASFIDDWIEFHILKGYEFESRIGYSEKLDYLVMAE